MVPALGREYQRSMTQFTGESIDSAAFAWVRCLTRVELGCPRPALRPRSSQSAPGVWACVLEPAAPLRGGLNRWYGGGAGALLFVPSVFEDRRCERADEQSPGFDPGRGDSAFEFPWVGGESFRDLGLMAGLGDQKDRGSCRSRCLRAARRQG